MARFPRWIAFIAMLLFTTAAVAASPEGIEVRLSSADTLIRGDVGVIVTVTVTNTGRHPVRLLRWQLPSAEPEGPLFVITRDGERVAYTGPVFKRAAPTDADFVRLDPGASLAAEVDLTGAYDLSRNGRYDIRYESRGGHGANAGTFGSATLQLWLEGRTAQGKRPPPPPPPGPSVSFTGNCTASQQTDLRSAVGGAASYAQQATTYLADYTPRQSSARYAKWFDANWTLQDAGWTTAWSHLEKIRSAFTTQALTLDCKCRQRNVYAYVYPNQPYKIFVCGAFWAAPMTGTDSKAGTLIHEMSHFSVVAGTDDWVYGQTGAASLAQTDPDKALNNADNHEYFSENTPALQ